MKASKYETGFPDFIPVSLCTSDVSLSANYTCCRNSAMCLVSTILVTLQRQLALLSDQAISGTITLTPLRCLTMISEQSIYV